ncbi:hypothetical protein KI387_011007, partial [Taxus chinensis]
YCPTDLDRLRHIHPESCFPEEIVRYYCAEILLAMEYLHMLGIVHRDLKPANVLVREDGHLLLADFDVSRYFYVHHIVTQSLGTYCPVKNKGTDCVKKMPKHGIGPTLTTLAHTAIGHFKRTTNMVLIVDQIITAITVAVD